MLVYLLIATLLPIVYGQTFPSPLATYVNEKVLKDGIIRLSWNYTSTMFIGELHAKTNGWVGLGLSPNGGMDGSDVIIAKIVSGNVEFSDRYIVGRAVMVDKKQDWTLVGSSIVNGYLIVQFSRKIDTCDPNGEDLKIESGTPRVIYAWNDALASDGNIGYHGATNRGSIALQLLTSLSEPLVITSSDAIETYDFNVSVTLPPLNTYYHCHMFKLPTNLITNKRHLIRTITNITAGNENYVHHWLMYQCSSAFESVYLYNHSQPLPGHCFDSSFTNSANPPRTWTTVRPYCLQISLLWAIGGDLKVDFPNGLGFPIGGSDREFTYFYLEIHYNNPALTSGVVDKTGIQWHLTPNLRANEIGVFTNGANSDWSGIIIPPGETGHTLRYYCRSNCLDALTQAGDVTVFAAAPHTHTVGSAVVTKLIRNGAEVAYLDKSLNYDFNYQYLNFLQNPVIIKQGDEIETKCTYKTVGKSDYTFGGIASSQEMCLEFLFYYPRRPNVGMCLSIPDGWTTFYTQLAASGSLTVSRNPPTFSSIGVDLQTLKKDSTTVATIKEFFENSKQQQFCLTNNALVTTTYARINPTALVEKDSCKSISAKQTSSQPFMYLLMDTIIIMLCAY